MRIDPEVPGRLPSAAVGASASLPGRRAGSCAEVEAAARQPADEGARSGPSAARQLDVRNFGGGKDQQEPYISQILRLALRRTGCTDQALMLERLERPLPWERGISASCPPAETNVPVCGSPGQRARACQPAARPGTR